MSLYYTYKNWRNKHSTCKAAYFLILSHTINWLIEKHNKGQRPHEVEFIELNSQCVLWKKHYPKKPRKADFSWNFCDKQPSPCFYPSIRISFLSLTPLWWGPHLCLFFLCLLTLVFIIGIGLMRSRAQSHYDVIRLHN